MRGNLGKQTTNAVEEAAARHKEKCELRLARIQNGKEPSHKNTPWTQGLSEDTDALPIILEGL